VLYYNSELPQLSGRARNEKGQAVYTRERDSLAAERTADGMADFWHSNLFNGKCRFIECDKDICQSRGWHTIRMYS